MTLALVVFLIAWLSPGCASVGGSADAPPVSSTDSSGTVLPGNSESEIQVALDSPLRFRGLGGAPLELPTGMYTIHAGAPHTLEVQQDDKRFIIEATQAPHDEELAQPVAYIIYVSPAEIHLGLRLPGGVSLDTVGSELALRKLGIGGSVMEAGLVQKAVTTYRKANPAHRRFVPGQMGIRQSTVSSLVEILPFYVLTYNVYMRPTSLFKNGQAIRAGLLPAHLQDHDVIIFNEVFDDDARATLLSGLTAYPHRTTILGQDQGFAQDGGVMIVSKWPILSEAERFFGSDCTGWDCNSKKGVKYAKVCKQGHSVHVFGTHTNANRDPASVAAREKQFSTIRQFIDMMNLPKADPVLIGGDLNVPKFLPGLWPEYITMLNALSAGDPSAFTTPRVDERELPQWPYCTYCYGFNDLAADPADGRTILDYVLYSLRHKLPDSAESWFQRPLSLSPWKEFFWEGSHRDLSDHYPMLSKFVFKMPILKSC